MISETDAGVYGASTKIPNLISMVSTVFYQAWNMSAIAENDSKGRSAFYTQVFDAYQAILCLAAGCASFFASGSGFRSALPSVGED